MENTLAKLANSSLQYCDSIQFVTSIGHWNEICWRMYFVRCVSFTLSVNLSRPPILHVVLMVLLQVNGTGTHWFYSFSFLIFFFYYCNLWSSLDRWSWFQLLILGILLRERGREVQTSFIIGVNVENVVIAFTSKTTLIINNNNFDYIII